MDRGNLKAKQNIICNIIFTFHHLKTNRLFRINIYSLLHTFWSKDKRKTAETYQEMWKGVSCSSPTSSSSDEESNSLVLMASAQQTAETSRRNTEIQCWESHSFKPIYFTLSVLSLMLTVFKTILNILEFWGGGSTWCLLWWIIFSWF